MLARMIIKPYAPYSRKILVLCQSYRVTSAIHTSGCFLKNNIESKSQLVYEGPLSAHVLRLRVSSFFYQHSQHTHTTTTLGYTLPSYLSQLDFDIFQKFSLATSAIGLLCQPLLYNSYVADTVPIWAKGIRRFANCSL